MLPDELLSELLSKINCPWCILVVAGVCEVLWVYYMKKCDGFSKPKETTLFLMFNVLSTIFLALSLRSIEISIAYPVWVGIGSVGAVTLGVLMFNERLSTVKFFLCSMVCVGVIGLKLS
ncbi:multidrug efflux SMR transporter [Aeromonas sp. R2-2]|uniref:multidrug efflux SMR transporter n=1 Tax=Aeromonas sp. R2-2 TaxID=3138460 RepID=UPI0034A3EF4D